MSTAKDVVLPSDVVGSVAAQAPASGVGRQNTMIDVKSGVDRSASSKSSNKLGGVDEGGKVGGVASTVKGGSVIQGSGSSSGNGVDETIR